MKRTLCFLLVTILLTSLGGSALAITPLEGNDIHISAPSAVLMEKMSGEVIYSKNPNDRLFPASITKIMTMLLIVEDIEAGKLSLDDTVTASARAASFGGSCVYLEEGEQMTVREMLKCIAVVSANDCAVAMAEHISASEPLFVKRMNQRAKELGLKNTHFTECTGLFDDKEHYTCAYDVALMSRELIRHDLIKEFTTIWMDSIRGGEFQLSNTNKLVYWYEGCTGLKTGYTSSSMYCLSATAEREGAEYIAVVMHGDSVDSRNEDAKTLLNYAFASCTVVPLLQNSPLPRVRVELGKEKTVGCRYQGSEYLLLPKNGGAAKYELDMLPYVSAPVREGDRLGTLIVTSGGETVARIPVCADADVPRLGFWGILGLLSGSLFGI